MDQGKQWTAYAGRASTYLLIYGPNEPADIVEVAEDGSAPFPDNRRPTAIVPKIPVYPIEMKPIPLTGTGGHRIVMRFEPNDIGKADFRAQRLSIEKGVLVMPRRDLELMLHFNASGDVSSLEHSLRHIIRA